MTARHADRSVLRRLSRRSPQHSRGHILSSRHRRHVFEALEDRCMLATIFTVDSVADNTLVDGSITLREAVYAANSDSPVGDAPAGSGADVIQFAPSLAGQTIHLNGNEIVVAADLTITGPGKDLLTIDADLRSWHFEVNPAVTLTMSGLTLANGNAGEGASGGSIYCDGTLDLTDVVLSDNRAGQDGGAIHATAASPAITLTNCDVTGNQAVGNGGGIDQLAGTLTITGGNVDLNKAAGGGGIYATGFGLCRHFRSQLHRQRGPGFEHSCRIRRWHLVA